jgi:hypothetical protein
MRIRRQFLALLVLAAMSMAVGGMACGDIQADPDDTDETEGAT